ncbi:T9SS type A sorting domain-containing protein [Rubrivirga sp.]|uniref:T9SS type A sorting domain-containing protein n=1 Tax=Rubrivirga sp. TaxID=1885344 RepID=UPI003C77F9DD
MLVRAFVLAALVASPSLAQATFTVTTTDNSGDGSLRQAISDANRSRNAAGGPDRIAFAIPGTGPFTIAPTFSLPDISEAVVLDGLSQPGADCSTWPATLMIVLDGERAGVQIDGLTFISGGGSTVRGLVINRFDGDGFDVKGSGGNTFGCNYVGTDVTGTLARPNGDDGVDIESPGNVVGGPTVSARNLISGNGNDGVDIDGFGIDASDNVIQGNYIGVAADGASPMGNGDEGIELQFGATGTLVGGTEPGEGKVIAVNVGNGVKVEESTSIRNSFFSNVVFGNDELAIDLGDDGRSRNDTDDRDAGANGGQNYPVVTEAVTVANTGTTVVRGTLNSVPSATYRVEVFASQADDSQAERYVGALEVVTDSGGDVAFEVELAEPVPAGQFMTMTATDASGNTSELSDELVVAALNNVASEDGGDLDLEVVLAPNPASRSATVSFETTEAVPATVTVFDVVGRVVQSAPSRAGLGTREVPLDVSVLPPGVYVIRVATARSTRTAQLTVAR